MMIQVSLALLYKPMVNIQHENSMSLTTANTSCIIYPIEQFNVVLVQDEVDICCEVKVISDSYGNHIPRKKESCSSFKIVKGGLSMVV